MIEIVFWTLAVLVIYVYAGYPLLLALIRSLGGVRRVRRDEGYPPAVTLVISAYNEAGVIGEKLANSLALDYPAGKLEILVVSDASSDGTDSVVEGIGDPRVHLVRMQARGGKTVGLNAAVQRASGELVVFSDANAMYEKDALAKLARNFADPDVGAVVGESTYAAPEAESQRSEGLYWKYEVAIKRLESDIGSVVGGDGAIYAIRRRLYVPMAPDALSDFVNPLQIVRAGHRCVYDGESRSIERAAESFEKEFRRKVRIVNRAWRAMTKMRALLNPLRFGLMSWELFSHKVLRWLMPFILLGVLATNAALVTSAALYVVLMGVQIVFYSLAALGWSWRRRRQLPSIVSVPFYFCLVNIAAALGICEALVGRTYTVWTTARAQDHLGT